MSVADELNRCSATEQARLIRAKTISPVELLQAHLGLTVFQLGAYLVGLGGAVPQRDVQAQSYTFIRSAGVEKLPNRSSHARAGRNIGGLGAEGVRETSANSCVRIKRAAQPGAAIKGKQPE